MFCLFLFCFMPPTVAMYKVSTETGEEPQGQFAKPKFQLREDESWYPSGKAKKKQHNLKKKQNFFLRYL